MKTRAAASGVLLMLGAMVCFSLSDAFAKRLALHLPVVEIVWCRYLALATTIGWLFVQRGRPAWPERPVLQAARAGAVVSSALFFNLGLATLSLAAATALVFSSPLFVIALSVVLLHERVPARQWAWALLGFVGVLVVAKPAPGSFNATALWPIASSMAWAVAMVLTRRLAANHSVLTTQTWSCTLGLVALTALLPFGFHVPSVGDAVEMVAMGACWAGAQWMVMVAYTRSPAAAVAPLAYTQLIWANLLSIVLLQQWPETSTVAGTLLIAIAGAGAAHALGSTAAPIVRTRDAPPADNARSRSVAA